jgi:LysR family hydrogen peroxide-inducible transcriptional activator
MAGATRSWKQVDFGFRIEEIDNDRTEEPAMPPRPLPSLRQLRYLAALDEHRSFTRAAEACFATQSTLSAGLKELEATLGLRLVERDRRSVSMTPAGDEIAARARGLLAAAEDLVEVAARAAAPMTGLLRVGMIPTIAPFVLPALLPALRRRHPELRLALREDLTHRLLERLSAGGLDCALIALPYDTKGLLLRELCEDELLLVAPSGDRRLASRRLAISGELAGELLLLEEGHCLRDHVLQACGRERVARVEGVEATSLLTLVHMVASGLGLALVPELAIAGGLLSGLQLGARRLMPPAPRRGLALVARASTARRAEFDALAAIVASVARARIEARPRRP